MAVSALHLELAFSRPETTLSVTRGAARLMRDLGYAPLMEVGLPNGRRADVMALGPKGEVVICEVKSGIDDYRVDRKWQEYGPFCDAFYFAVAPEFPQGVLPDEPGLIVADGFGGAVVRDAPATPLASARRKAKRVKPTCTSSGSAPSGPDATTSTSSPATKPSSRRRRAMGSLGARSSTASTMAGLRLASSVRVIVRACCQ